MILTNRRARQENYRKFEAILSYIMSIRLARTKQDLVFIAISPNPQPLPKNHLSIGIGLQGQPGSQGNKVKPYVKNKPNKPIPQEHFYQQAL